MDRKPLRAVRPLLTPTLPTEAFGPSGPIPREVEGERVNGIAYTYPFNFTGHPAASVPAGLTDAGLPCGLQIVAPRHRDDLVLRASYAYEQARPFPPLPGVDRSRPRAGAYPSAA